MDASPSDASAALETADTDDAQPRESIADATPDDE
jgi:hypothetical protein